jgi:hypothetical protein
MYAYHIVRTYSCVCKITILAATVKKDISICCSTAAAECRRAYGSLQTMVVFPIYLKLMGFVSTLIECDDVSQML